MSDTEASKGPHLRILHRAVCILRRSEGRRVLHTGKRSKNNRKYLKAFRRKTRLRPMLRFRRNVRTVRKVHSGARRKQKQHLSLWTGSQCRHLENGQNEYGNPRNRCKLWRSPRRYFFQRPAFHAEVRLHHGKSALQLKQLGAGQIAERPSLGIRISTRRQRKLRLDRTHDLPPGSKRKNRSCSCKWRPFHPDLWRRRNSP